MTPADPSLRRLYYPLRPGPFSEPSDLYPLPLSAISTSETGSHLSVRFHGGLAHHLDASVVEAGQDAPRGRPRHISAPDDRSSCGWVESHFWLPWVDISSQHGPRGILSLLRWPLSDTCVQIWKQTIYDGGPGRGVTIDTTDEGRLERLGDYVPRATIRRKDPPAEEEYEFLGRHVGVSLLRETRPYAGSFEASSLSFWAGPPSGPIGPLW